MPIEKKDLLDFLGLKEEPETIDAFKEAFQKDFIARSAAANDPVIRDAAASKLGNVMGKAESIFKQELKYFGIDKVEGEKLEEIIPFGLGALKTQFETLKAGDKKTKDQKFLEVEAERDKYKTGYETEKQGREAANQLIEQKDKEFNSKIKTITIEQQLGEVFKTIPFTDDYKNDPIRQLGFKNFLANETQFDLNDKGELVILKKDGTPFTNDAKNIHKTPQQIIDEFADKAKYKANNNLNNRPPATVQQPAGAGGGNDAVHNYKRKS